MRCGERPGPALHLQLAGRSADRCPPAEMGGSVSDIPRGERDYRLSWKPVGTESMSSTPRLGRAHVLVRVHASRSGLRGFARGARATNQPEALVVDNVAGHRLGAP